MASCGESVMAGSWQGSRIDADRIGWRGVEDSGSTGPGLDQGVVNTWRGWLGTAMNCWAGHGLARILDRHG